MAGEVVAFEVDVEDRRLVSVVYDAVEEGLEAGGGVDELGLYGYCELVRCV